MRNLALVLLIPLIIQAQTTPPATPSAATPSPEAGAPIKLPMNVIEQLVAPIALYPDVLISQVLPAATFPTDIVMAARWCADHPDLKGLDQQQWDLSVISICRYPPVIEKMNKDLDWTNALGAAFMDQPDDVMSAIQTLRQGATTSGTLQTTPQQTVVTEEEAIRIVPTEKEVVYVPQYDPQIIYAEENGDASAAAAVTAGAISFGTGMALGSWLDNDCDWNAGSIVACRPGYWGGWGWHGAVNWDNDWRAYRGARRGYVAGENGAAYVGPRGAAIWGENGRGAAWRRPVARGPAPAYTGRYAQYKNVNANRRNLVAGNQVNVNRNNVNIDRGDRTRVGGTQAIRSTTGASVLNNPGNRTDIARQHNRGQQSRAVADRAMPSAQARQTPAARPQAQRAQAAPRSSTAQRSSSAFGSNHSRSDARSFSSRGQASHARAASGGSRGGGRR